MTEEHQGTEWTFVIDTNEYAGNFEREMCAWLTGQVGECDVGKEMAAVARAELGPKTTEYFENNIGMVADDHRYSTMQGPM